MQLDRRSVLTRTGELTALATLGVGGASARRPIPRFDDDEDDPRFDDDEDDPRFDDDEDDAATVRVAHASPDAPAVRAMMYLQLLEFVVVAVAALTYVTYQ